MVNKHVLAIWKFEWIRKYNDKCKWIYNLKNKKLNKLSDLGINPYPYNYDFNKKTYTREICDNIDESKIFSLAGRIMFLRRMGNATFANIVDERGNIQVFFSKKLIGIENYDILKLIDVSDIVWVEGTVFKTQTGEITIIIIG